MPTAKHRRRRGAALALMTVTACGGASSPAPAPSRASAPSSSDAGVAAAKPVASPSSTTPPVVVAMVVDQFAAWIADERMGALPETGGFARLRREGTYAREMRYAHAVTDTAPGHAALFTGAPPHLTGIATNERVPTDGASREIRPTSFLHDPAASPVTTRGREVGPTSSLASLRVDTVADVLREARPDAAIVSVSLKDRGAIFGGGRAPSATIWFDPKNDLFATSTAFATAMPAWARDLAEPGVTARLVKSRDATWRPLDAAWIEAHARSRDEGAGEGDYEGLGVRFPHVVATAKRPAFAVRATPFADELVLALATAAIDGERMRERSGLLAISLSAHDYVNHVFGPDSWEAWDELRRLDAALGRFFETLDRAFGPEGYAVMLSADHGSTPLPELPTDLATRGYCAPPSPGKAGDRWARPCKPGGRILPDAFAAELRAIAARVLGPGTHGEASWVAGVVEPYVVFTDEAAKLDDARRARFVAEAKRALLKHPEVARVVDARELPKECPAEADASLDALVCRAFVRGTRNELYVVAAEGSFFDPLFTVGHGMSHGSPYLFDRTVPLFVRPARRAGAPASPVAGRVIDAPISYKAYARTLGSLLGVAPTAAAAAGLDVSAAVLPGDAVPGATSASAPPSR